MVPHPAGTNLTIVYPVPDQSAVNVCVRACVCDEPLFSCVWQLWYTGSMKAVCVWLTERLDLQLHTFQLKTLIKMVKVSRSTAPLPVVQCLFRGNISSQTSFHLLLSSDHPSLLLISTFPKPTEDLP